MEEILTKYTKTQDIMSDLDAISGLVDIDDVLSSTCLKKVVSNILGSRVESDGTLLIANRLSHLHNQPEIWKFYQDIISRSRDKFQSPYLIAMAAAHQASGREVIVRYNVTRLVYLCISQLMTKDMIGHSNFRIGCARILLRVNQYSDASWVLRELRYILSLDNECENEFPFLANNKSVLEELASTGPTNSVRVLAKHILQTSGLWKTNHSC